MIVLVLLVLHALLVMADSGTLTAGLVGTVPAELRGAALGLYSLAGFAGGKFAAHESRGHDEIWRGYTNKGAKTSVIVLKSLISTCRLGPAVSLKGSPTVSPTTAAL